MNPGIANLILWPSIQTRHREAMFGAHLMMVEGELQSEMNIVHVIAQKVRDYSHWLGALKTESRDFRPPPTLEHRSAPLSQATRRCETRSAH